MKAARADELITHLRRDIDKVKRGEYFEFRIGVEDGLGISVKPRRQVPSRRWGVVIGEIVHDLRSSLDHLTWALSVTQSGPAPEPPTGWWRGIEFPIFTDRQLFYEVDRAGRPTLRSGLRDLRGVDPALVGRFDAVQPFHHGARAERQPLALLHALSIHDKHRALPLVAIAGRRGVIKAEAAKFGARGTSRVRRVPLPIPDEGAELARLTMLKGRGGPKIGMGDTVEIQFEASVDFDFGFASGPPAFGGELVATLRRLHGATVRTLRYFAEPRLFE